MKRKKKIIILKPVKVKERRKLPPTGAAHRDRKNDYNRNEFKDRSNW